MRDRWVGMQGVGRWVEWSNRVLMIRRYGHVQLQCAMLRIVALTVGGGIGFAAHLIEMKGVGK